MSEWKKVKIGDNKIEFKYFPLSFINDPSEKRKQIINTVIFKYIENKYQNIQALSDLITGTQYGYNASALKNGRNKFLRISDIKDGAVNWGTVPFCDCKDEETYKLFENDILIARTGGTTGKSFLIDSAPKNAIYAGYLIRIRAKENINPHFVYAFLNSYAYWPQISEFKAGSAQPNVNAEKLKKLLIPTCPRDIQDKVIDFLKTGETDDQELRGLLKNIEDFFEGTEKQTNLFNSQKSHLTLLRQQILQDAISGKLTADWRAENPDTEPASKLLEQILTEKEKFIAGKKIKKEKPLPKIAKDEVPFGLPEEWKWCRLGEVFSSTSGGTPTRGDSNFWENGNINWLKSGELNDEIINFDSEEKITKKGLEKSSTFLFPKETILIAMYGATAGKLAILNIESTTNQAVCGFLKNSFIEQKFLFHFLRAVRKKMVAESWGQAQPNISQTYLKKFLFPLPPRAEQRAIVAKVERLMGYVSQLEEKIAQNANNAKMLIRAFLTEVFQ